MNQRWLWFGLAASLALNLFFLSLGAEFVLHLRQDAMVSIKAVTEENLSRPDRVVLETNMLAARPAIAVAFNRVHAARYALDAALRAVPPDPVAIRGALDTWRGAVSNFLMSFEDPLVTALMDMSQAGRDVIADRGDEHSRFAVGLINP